MRQLRSQQPPRENDDTMVSERELVARSLSKFFVCDVMSKVKSRVKIVRASKRSFEDELLGLVDKSFLNDYQEDKVTQREDEVTQMKPEPVTPNTRDDKGVVLAFEVADDFPQTPEMKDEKQDLTSPDLHLQSQEDLSEPEAMAVVEENVISVTPAVEAAEEKKVPPLKLIEAFKRTRENRQFAAHPYSLGKCHLLS